MKVVILTLTVKDNVGAELIEILGNCSDMEEQRKLRRERH